MKTLKRNIPFLATLSVCVLLYIAAGVNYDGFFSARVFLNFLSDNAVLGVAAIGLTFVILSGGIDLSVGSVVGVVSIVLAILVDGKGVPPAVAMPLVIAAGTIFGAGVVNLIPEAFRQLGDFRLIMFAVILLLMVIYQPHGVFSITRRMAARA